jgi:hypothetical protein
MIISLSAPAALAGALGGGLGGAAGGAVLGRNLMAPRDKVSAELAKRAYSSQNNPFAAYGGATSPAGQEIRGAMGAETGSAIGGFGGLLGGMALGGIPPALLAMLAAHEGHSSSKVEDLLALAALMAGVGGAGGGLAGAAYGAGKGRDWALSNAQSKVSFNKHAFNKHAFNKHAFRWSGDVLPPVVIPKGYDKDLPYHVAETLAKIRGGYGDMSQYGGYLNAGMAEGAKKGRMLGAGAGAVLGGGLGAGVNALRGANPLHGLLGGGVTGGLLGAGGGHMYGSNKGYQEILKQLQPLAESDALRQYHGSAGGNIMQSLQDLARRVGVAVGKVKA